MIMIADVYQRRMIEKRKENRLCISCGEPLDREGVHCTTCREKINKDVKETRRWYQQNGICPRCGKNPIMGDEKNCPECRAESTNRATERREKNREKYNEKQRITQRKIYYERIEQGICTRCGKRKADYGYKTCGICRTKGRETWTIKNKKPKRSERILQGLCYFCDNPVKDGYKVCEKHYQMNIEKLDNDKTRKAREEIKEFESMRIIGLMNAKKESTNSNKL